MDMKEAIKVSTSSKQLAGHVKYSCFAALEALRDKQVQLNTSKIPVKLMVIRGVLKLFLLPAALTT